MVDMYFAIVRTNPHKSWLYKTLEASTLEDLIADVKSECDDESTPNVKYYKAELIEV